MNTKPTADEQIDRAVEEVIASVLHVDIDGMDGDSWDRILVRAALKHADLLSEQAKADSGVWVTREDANNYCLILRLLGMEDEGNPVAEVERLMQPSPVVVPQGVDEIVSKGTKGVFVTEDDGYISHVVVTDVFYRVYGEGREWNIGASEFLTDKQYEIAKAAPSPAEGEV